MKKLMTVVCICGLLMSCISAIPANAEDMEEAVYVEDISPDTENAVYAEERSTGLLYDYNISVANYNGSLKVTTNTKANEQMQIIGIKDLTVQYSYDGSNWYDEWNAGDFLTENSGTYQLNNYIISLERSGCYYRATCKHYAKKSLLSTQSEKTTSNAVWIG